MFTMKMRFYPVAIAGLCLLSPLATPKSPAAELLDLSAIAADSSQSLAATTATFDTTYVLGPGDVIDISIFNIPEYSGEQQVLADGTLNLPAVGRLSVSGLTVAQTEIAISERYQQELRHPAITVNLLRPRPLRVAIAGEIQQPGLYNLSITDNAQFPSVAQAIQTAGGVTQSANLRAIQVQRTHSGTPETVVVNLWDLIQNGNLSEDIPLRDGDEIVIPAVTAVDLVETTHLAASNLAANQTESIDIAIVGEVARPGAYKLGDNGQPTITQAIQTAGGINPMANLSQVEVRRPTRQGTEQLISLNLLQLVQTGDLSQDLVLQQGDTLFVPTAAELSPAEAAQLASINLSPTSIQVNVIGEVENPGVVQIEPNSTLSQAVLAAGGFNQRASEDVQLIRLNPNGTVSQQDLEVDLTENPNPETNPMLMQNDVIVVSPSGIASFSDGFSNLLSPFLQILSPFGLF